MLPFDPTVAPADKGRDRNVFASGRIRLALRLHGREREQAIARGDAGARALQGAGDLAAAVGHELQLGCCGGKAG